MYIIKDWADNTCFKGIKFNSFEEAWGYIYEHVNNEEDYQEYFVVEV